MKLIIPRLMFRNSRRRRPLATPVANFGRRKIDTGNGKATLLIERLLKRSPQFEVRWLHALLHSYS
jgi:hypothetical protein